MEKVETLLLCSVLVELLDGHVPSSPTVPPSLCIYPDQICAELTYMEDMEHRYSLVDTSVTVSLTPSFAYPCDWNSIPFGCSCPGLQ
ncbi:hypothetical protein BDV59DRAFT_187542 [Aspergillus ambiguus]|uniref:uncharacterized protein n=1 Tax=Aspergillus ambiguus TaxID=176160 RepID=UPI003CCD8005